MEEIHREMIVVVGWMNRGVSGWLQLIDRFDTVCTNIRKKHGMVIGGLTYTAVDIGECGGSTIIQIEEMGNMFQRMQDAYVTLLAQTISYMTNRKESLDTKESNATATVSE